MYLRVSKKWQFSLDVLMIVLGVAILLYTKFYKGKLKGEKNG